MKQYKLTNSFKLFLVLSTILTISCSQEKTNDLNLNKINNAKLTKNFEIENDSLFSYIDDIKLINDQKLLIFDKGKSRIVLMSTQGRVINKFNNSKGGVLELTYLTKIDVFNNKLYILDATQSKISRYKLGSENQLIHEENKFYPNRSSFAIKKFNVLSDSVFIFGFIKGFSKNNLYKERKLIVEKYNSNQWTYEKLLEVKSREYYRINYKNGFRVGYLPFGTYPVVKFNNGSFYYGNNKNFKIKKYTKSGEKISTIVNYDYSSANIEEIEYKQVANYRFQGDMPEGIQSKIPKKWRYFETFLVDNTNQIWIATNYKKYHSGLLWIIINSKGKELFKVILNQSTIFKLIYENKLYGITGFKTGDQSLVSYTLKQ